MPKLTGFAKIKWDIIMLGSFAWVFLWTLISLLLFCTLIFAPLGIITWVIANTPMVYLGSKRRDARIKKFEKSQKET